MLLSRSTSRRLITLSSSRASSGLFTAHLLDDVDDLIKLRGFVEEVVCAFRQAFLAVGFEGVIGQYDDLDVRIDGLDVPDEMESGSVLQDEVEDDCIGKVLL